MSDIASRLKTSIPELLSLLMPGAGKRSGKSIVFRTPWREDNHPSLNVDIDSGAWKDWGTGDGGGLFDLIARINHLDSPANAARWLEERGHLAPDPSYHNGAASLATPAPRANRPPARPIPQDGDSLDRWAALRGFTRAALVSIGARPSATIRGQERADCLSIPMRNNLGKITGYRHRRDDGKPIKPPKCKALTNEGGKLGLMGPSPLPPGPLLICEGESDLCAVLSTIPDIAAVGVPGATCGEAVIEYLAAIARDRDCIILADSDDAGGTLISSIVAALPHTRIATMPDGFKDIDEALRAAPDHPERVAIIDRLIATADIRRRESKCFNVSDLLANPPPPVEWIVPGVLPSVGLYLLSGPPKLGKSFLALGLCWAVACGGFLFGSDRFRTRQAKILGLFLEDSKGRIYHRLIGLQESMNAATIPEMRLGIECPPIGPELEAFVLDEVSRMGDGPKLVIIDILAKVQKATDGRRNAYKSDTDEMGTLQTFAQRNNLCIVAITHDRKAPAKGEESDPFMAVTGTAGIIGAVDGALLLRRKRKSTTGKLFVSGREMGEQEIPLRFEDGYWVIDPEAEQEPVNENDARIVSLLYDRVSITAADVMEGLQVDRNHARQLLYRAENRGVIKRLSAGNFGLVNPK